MAIVDVQGTVTGGLVGMEITLYQEAGSTMLEHAQVAGISDTGVRVYAGR